jgi:hypothetical protein
MYTSGNKNAPPSRISGPTEMSFTAPMFEITSNETKTAITTG